MDENEKNEKVAKMVDSLELHQLQKLAARARAGEELSAADLALLKRLGHKLESVRPSSGAAAKKKVKRGRPTKTIHLAEQIERLALEKLLERQERGDKLTAAEFAFLAKIKQMDNEKAVTAKITAKLPLSERLQAKKESWFESLCWVAENSKSHMARVTAVPASFSAARRVRYSNPASSFLLFGTWFIARSTVAIKALFSALIKAIPP